MTNLHCERRGVGPLLVMLHGWALNLRVFDTLAAELAQHYTVLTIDLPGHGRSNANRWAALDELLLTLPAPFVLLGWSLGGQLALQFTQRAPERVSGLVLVAATPRFLNTKNWAAGLSASVLAGFAAQLATDYRRTVAEFLELQVRGSAHATQTLTELRAALLSHGEASPDALAVGLELLQQNDLRAALPQIAAPTLIIAGQYDRVTPTAAARAMADKLPAGKLLEIRRAGHAPFLSHTAACAAAIAALRTS
ncbi:MAG TPA: pimeloyl-ACP methyl ester esterase BioH [Steroidobacteraceae bacterium]|nr:pimeloyl-ACP methyl ester esterase BioH [Steroidobacteraceae bacterium]HRX88369.1 pimeloyl-ACP methyl ester esterase BioH [Steroidobacteraceae bacterium]